MAWIFKLFMSCFYSHKQNCFGGFYSTSFRLPGGVKCTKCIFAYCFIVFSAELVRQNSSVFFLQSLNEEQNVDSLSVQVKMGRKQFFLSLGDREKNT